MPNASVPIWILVIMGIVLFTVPALIVFLTVYNLLKQYLDGQYRFQLLDYKQKNHGASMPIRMQAYERLALFCDRITVPNLILRIRQDGMTAAQYKLTLMLAVQQEFEYNITQQVYVSEKLWEIIQLAKDDVINTISIAYDKVSPKASAKVLNQALIQFHRERESSGPEKAMIAVKREVALLF